MAEEQFKVKVRPIRSSSRQIESTNNLEVAKEKEGEISDRPEWH
jgi:hypothetical protein